MDPPAYAGVDDFVFSALRTGAAWPRARSRYHRRSRRRRLLRRTLLLAWGRRVALWVTHRHGLGNLRRAVALSIAYNRGSRLTVVVRPVDSRRNEEQNLARLARYTFALEQIADDRQVGDARRAVLSFSFLIAEHAAHDRGAAVGNQYLGFHTLRVDAWRSVDRDRSVDAVVLSDDMQHDCSGIRDLRCYFQTQRHRDESRGKDQHAATATSAGLRRGDWDLLAAGDFGLTIVQGGDSRSGDRSGIPATLSRRDERANLRRPDHAGRQTDNRIRKIGAKGPQRIKNPLLNAGWSEPDRIGAA